MGRIPAIPFVFATLCRLTGCQSYDSLLPRLPTYSRQITAPSVSQMSLLRQTWIMSAHSTLSVTQMLSPGRSWRFYNNSLTGQVRKMTSDCSDCCPFWWKARPRKPRKRPKKPPEELKQPPEEPENPPGQSEQPPGEPKQPPGPKK